MSTRHRFNGKPIMQFNAAFAALGIALAASLPGSSWATAAESPLQAAGAPAAARSDRLPRKVLLGTVICGDQLFKM